MDSFECWASRRRFRGSPGRRWRRRRIVIVSLAAGLLALGPGGALAQVSVGNLDDFQDATTQGWVAALGVGLPPVPPAVVADAGPTGAGDFALRLTGTGSPLGAGGKLVVNNVDSRWIGDYTAAGVGGLVVDVNNPNAVPLTLRVGIDEPPLVTVGGRWVTDGVVVPAMSGWVTLVFSLDPADLLPGDAQAIDASATLANVGVIRLIHSPAANYQGEPIAGQLDVDDVEAVPEPSLLLGLLAGGTLLRGMGAARRRI